MLSSLGKMPTTSARRLTSLFSRSSGLVECNFVRCWVGKPVYGMQNGRVVIPVRRALLYYALKRLGLDTDPAARKPQDQQIILLNTNDVPGASA